MFYIYLLKWEINTVGGHVQITWTNEGGEGVAQMTTTLNKSYLVKVFTWGRGVKIAQNSVHVVCTRPLVVYVRTKVDFIYDSKYESIVQQLLN